MKIIDLGWHPCAGNVRGGNICGWQVHAKMSVSQSSSGL